MAFQPCPSIASSVISGTMDGQLVGLTQHWFASGAITGASLSGLATSLSNWVSAQLAPLLSRDVTFNLVSCADLSTATGAMGEQSFTATGGVDQESAPNNVAAVISLRTAERGRSGHGRNFIPGLPNTLISLNTLDPDFIAALIAAYQLLPGAGSFVAGYQMVVLSRRTGGLPRANGIGIAITDITMKTNKVKSMRSREVGHGA